MSTTGLTADEWRARFAEQRWRAERDELWARVGGERESNSERRPSAIVVLRPAHEAGSADIPVSAQRVETAALAAGWAARVVASVAAVPRIGILRVVTVRGARHDERFWAAWWNGSFECAQYLVRGSAIERLAATDMATRRKLALTAADRAAERATVIPLVIPPSAPPKPVTIRGVFDAIEGRRLELA